MCHDQSDKVRRTINGQYTIQNKFVFFMMRKNSSSFTSPSPSLSASSIISCNSSSVILSPSSFAITVPIRFVDHLLQFLIRHPLTEFLRHPFQVLERYLPGLVVVEEAERFQDLVLRVPVQDLVRHHLEELFVLNSTTSVVIDVGYHFLNFLLLRFEPERAHSNFELLGID